MNQEELNIWIAEKLIGLVVSMPHCFYNNNGTWTCKWCGLEKGADLRDVKQDCPESELIHIDDYFAEGWEQYVKALQKLGFMVEEKHLPEDQSGNHCVDITYKNNGMLWMWRETIEMAREDSARQAQPEIERRLNEKHNS